MESSTFTLTAKEKVQKTLIKFLQDQRQNGIAIDTGAFNLLHEFSHQIIQEFEK